MSLMVVLIINMPFVRDAIHLMFKWVTTALFPQTDSPLQSSPLPLPLGRRWVDDSSTVWISARCHRWKSQTHDTVLGSSNSVTSFAVIVLLCAAHDLSEFIQQLWERLCHTQNFSLVQITLYSCQWSWNSGGAHCRPVSWLWTVVLPRD